jgi:sec-independent protein translocase protein TatC
MGADKRMSIIEHLEELRKRLIIAVIAVLVAGTVCYFFADVIIRILKAPAGDIVLHSFSPLDGFLVKWKVALYGGIALSFPVWAYELVAFIAPGLTPSERRFLLPLTAALFVLFALGTAFGYFMLSGMLQVLFGMFGPELEFFPTANQYISFVVFFMLATGLSFELPVAILALVRLGILPPHLLKKQRRIAYFILFVFAEVITPVADPIVAPLTVMLPMVILYELTIFLTRFVTSPQTKPVPLAQPTDPP